MFFLRLPGLTSVVEILADLFGNQSSEPFKHSRVQFSIACSEDNFPEMLAMSLCSINIVLVGILHKQQFLYKLRG